MIGVLGYFILILPCLIEIPVLSVIRADPDQTPRSAVSDLDLHCLPMSFIWDARCKWINWKALAQGETYSVHAKVRTTKKKLVLRVTPANNNLSPPHPTSPLTPSSSLCVMVAYERLQQCQIDRTTRCEDGIYNYIYMKR